MRLLLCDVEIDELGEMVVVWLEKKSLVLGVYPVSILTTETSCRC